MDGDGDLDVLSASANNDTIAWYENNGASPPTFTDHVIATNADGARSVYATDVDGDGDLDVLSASANDDKIAWYENRGGQLALATTNTAPGTIIAGHQDDVLRIVATHRGRAGDTDAELVTFDLLFEESAGDPLTTTEANALIEALHIYRDNGSGSFEPGADTLITTVFTLSLTAGTQTVTFADGDPNMRVAFGTPVTTFVVVELTSDAARQTPNQFRVMHMTEAGSTAEDRDYDLPLALEFAPNVASSICTAATSNAIYLPLVLKNFCDRYEPNDSRSTAWGPLASGQIIDDAQICEGDPRDIYYFDASGPVQVTIDLKNMSGNVDFDLYLWDETGSVPLDKSEHGAGQDEQIVHTLPGEGRYYVDVYRRSGTGSYTLRGSGW